MTAAPPPFELTASRGLVGWLAEVDASLAFTTYQAGKLFFLGRVDPSRIAVFERTFNRCMGLAADAQTLWLASLFQLWRLENFLPPGHEHADHDRLYVPTVGHTTGDVDAHDVALLADGRPVFVNTLFSCLAVPSETHSFRPLWQPRWISRLAAEDRCHLNGLAVDDGRPAYVTAVAESDVADGWREHRRSGGVVVDVASCEVIARGLSMPHSPRLHRGELWLCEAGSGFFGRVDRRSGAFERLVFCPGYARGLAFIGDYAVIGLSALRPGGTFAGLPLDDNLRARGAVARCGLLVVDLRRGDAVHWLRLAGVVTELYDVAILPGVRRPMALGLKTDEIRRTITIGPPL